jgi:hypothetical protein
MKTIISMLLLAIAPTLVSFSPYGGEGFEISLNGRVVIQRFGNDVNNTGSLQLNPASPNDKLTIKYYHCGRIGKHRTVTIKDGKDKIVKTLSFADSNEPVAGMSFYVKDILDLKKPGIVLKLYYSSTELPKGRMLTSVSVGSNALAKQ